MMRKMLQLMMKQKEMLYRQVYLPQVEVITRTAGVI
jgi:hypothetical protein